MTVAYQEVLVVAPPGIVVQNITVDQGNHCATGACTLSVNVTWINTGKTRNSFLPNITIDNIPISPPPLMPESLEAGMSSMHTFIVSGLTEGMHTIYTDSHT